MKLVIETKDRSLEELIKKTYLKALKVYSSKKNNKTLRTIIDEKIGDDILVGRGGHHIWISGNEPIERFAIIYLD